MWQVNRNHPKTGSNDLQVDMDQALINGLHSLYLIVKGQEDFLCMAFIKPVCCRPMCLAILYTDTERLFKDRTSLAN